MAPLIATPVGVALINHGDVLTGLPFVSTYSLETCQKKHSNIFIAIYEMGFVKGLF